MKVSITPDAVAIWLSARDTYAWAHKIGAAWPCSWLADKRLVACFDSNGLYDVTINGGKGDQDAPADELNACIADHLDGHLPVTHPAYPVVVGQFRRTSPATA